MPLNSDEGLTASVPARTISAFAWSFVVPLCSPFDHQALNLGNRTEKFLLGCTRPIDLVQVFLSIADHPVR